jgi:SAM-dependent methyltransferase
MLPLDLPTHKTCEFVERFLGRRRRLLEVGCGDGRLALMLREKGHEIIGVDLSLEYVRLARRKGLDVRQADFLGFEEEPFDAVLFTRSLHHISPVVKAVARAQDLLNPGGVLLAEEFALERADQSTAAWYYRLQAYLAASEALRDEPAPGPDDPLVRWEKDHLHVPALASGEALLTAVGSCLDLCLVERTSYLYRTLCGKLRETSDNWLLANRICEAEERLVQRGALSPVGLRIAAIKRSGGC